MTSTVRRARSPLSIPLLLLLLVSTSVLAQEGEMDMGGEDFSGDMGGSSSQQSGGDDYQIGGVNSNPNVDFGARDSLGLENDQYASDTTAADGLEPLSEESATGAGSWDARPGSLPLPDP